MDHLSSRVAERFINGRAVRALEVGGSFFTDHLKLHHFHGSLRITDLENAGKRGKLVRELTLIPTAHDDETSEKVIKEAVQSILRLPYDQAKRELEESLARDNLFKLHERELRGVDVEPRGTTIKLEKKFPDGTIVTIESSPHNFMVKDSKLIDRPGFEAHGFRQDTGYWNRGKKDGIVFYGWLKDNLSKASNMGILELMQVWDRLGVTYNSH